MFLQRLGKENKQKKERSGKQVKADLLSIGGPFLVLMPAQPRVQGHGYKINCSDGRKK